MERSELIRALLRVDTAPDPPPRRALRRVKPIPGESAPARLRHCALKLQQYPRSSPESSPRGPHSLRCVVSARNLDDFPLRRIVSAANDAGFRYYAPSPSLMHHLPENRVAGASSCVNSMFYASNMGMPHRFPGRRVKVRRCGMSWVKLMRTKKRMQRRVLSMRHLWLRCNAYG